MGCVGAHFWNCFRLKVPSFDKNGPFNSVFLKLLSPPVFVKLRISIAFFILSFIILNWQTENHIYFIAFRCNVFFYSLVVYNYISVYTFHSFHSSSKIYEKLKLLLNAFLNVSLLWYIYIQVKIFACHYVNTYNICVHT